MRHVVFSLGRDRYALQLSAVREIVVAPPSFTRVPRTSPSVKGVMTLRGRVVPVVELGKLLALPGDVPGEKIVLLELSRRDLGLLVSGVDGIEFIERLGTGVDVLPPVKGVARVGALTVTVLDVDGVDEAVSQSFASGDAIR